MTICGDATPLCPRSLLVGLQRPANQGGSEVTPAHDAGRCCPLPRPCQSGQPYRMKRPGLAGNSASTSQPRKLQQPKRTQKGPEPLPLGRTGHPPLDQCLTNFADCHGRLELALSRLHGDGFQFYGRI